MVVKKKPIKTTSLSDCIVVVRNPLVIDWSEIVLKAHGSNRNLTLFVFQMLDLSTTMFASTNEKTKKLRWQRGKLSYYHVSFTCHPTHSRMGLLLYICLIYICVCVSVCIFIYVYMCVSVCIFI